MLAQIAYILLGIGITTYTYYVTTTVEVAPALYIFFLLGFGLVVYGTFTLITSLIKPSSTTQQSRNNIRRCPDCGVKHYETSNYCHKCGAKL